MSCSDELSYDLVHRCITTSYAENICSVWDLGAMRETALLHGHTQPITALSLSHFALVMF